MVIKCLQLQGTPGLHAHEKIAFKIFKISGIFFGFLLSLMFLLPIVFPGFVASKIKKWTNNAINTQLDFSKARLSFFTVIIPALSSSLNLDLNINAAVKKISYESIGLTNFSGGMDINNGNLVLNKPGFAMIGTQVQMDATYASLSPTKAKFTYHIKADSFDIKRAYNEIKLFHDLATSAAKIQGIVSLD